MGNKARHFFLQFAIVLLLPLFMRGQERTHVILLRDITPKESLASKLDGNFLFAPHYSAETGVGLAFSYLSKANVTFIGDIASRDFALLGVMGNHPIKGGEWSLGYRASWISSSSDYWGAGYDNASNALNRGEYKRNKFFLQTDLLRHFSPNFYAGPSLAWEWVQWRGMQGGKDNVLGYGASAAYDTRNSKVSPSGGIFAMVHHMNYTSFGKKPFYSTTLQLNTYAGVWEGGILAADLLSQFTFGSVPWTMLPTTGGTERMRGYYRGRYSDNNALSVQVELRQHIWEILGSAVWVGAANVWGKNCSFNWGHTLPNAGAGLRIAIAGGATIRLDYGFGKNGQNGFVFGLNEAF